MSVSATIDRYYYTVSGHEFCSIRVLYCSNEIVRMFICGLFLSWAYLESTDYPSFFPQSNFLFDYGDVSCLLFGFYSDSELGVCGFSYIANSCVTNSFINSTLLLSILRDPLTDCIRPLNCLVRSVWKKYKVNNIGR